MIRRTLSLAFLAALVPLLMAQTKPAPAPTAPAATAPAEGIKIFLMDGSVLTGKISPREIDVLTRYGTLKIPFGEIKALTPGLESHPEILSKISSAIEDLGADGFPEREKATQTLQKLGGEIRPELDKALKTAEGEKQTRLQKLIEELDSQKPGEDDDGPAPWTRPDLITTNDFTLAGKITNASFSVESTYGSLNIKLADIRTIKRDGIVVEDNQKMFTVAGGLIPQRGFENTNIRLARGDSVSFIASGTITMTPWGNTVCTPDGSPNYGTVQPGNVAAGALIGKLGNGGMTFRIGSKSTYTADRAGVLQLGIAIPGDFSSYQFPGEYTVKVKINRKKPQ